MQQNLNKPSKDLLLELINIANGTSFVMEDLTFAAPQATSDDAPANTLMVVTATETNAFQGVKQFHYNRLDLGLMYNGLILELEDSSAITTVMDVVDILNQRYQTAISTDDIVDGPISKQSDGTTPVVITSKSGSFAYTGSVTWVLTAEPVEPVGEVRIYDGFFLANLNQAMFSPDLADVAVLNDPNLPSLSHPLGPDYDGTVHVSMATGGYENELFYIVNYPMIGSMADSLTKVYVTKDKGQSRVVVEATGQTVSDRNSVVCNGCAYYLGYDVVADGERVYRVAPDGAGGYEIEAVFELGGWFAQLEVAEGVLYLTDGEYLHYTADGVNWTRESLPPEMYIDSMVWHKDKLVGTGYTNAGSLCWERIAPGQYSMTPSSLIAIYPGIATNDTWFEVINFLSLGDDGLLLKLDGNDQGTQRYAEILKADSVLGPWTKVNSGSGVVSQNYGLIYDGVRVGLIGDNMTGLPYWALISVDKGTTWTGYAQDVDNPFNEPLNHETIGLGLYRIEGTTPPIVPVPTTTGLLLEPYPSRAGAPITHLIAEPEGGLLVSGQYISSVNGDQYGNDSETTNNIAALNPMGNKDWFRNELLFNSVNSILQLPDGSVLVGGEVNRYGAEVEDDTEFVARSIHRLGQDLTYGSSGWNMADAQASNESNATIKDMVRYSDGSGGIVAVGNVSTLDGRPCPGIISLNADGTDDIGFTSPFQSGTTTNLERVWLTASGRIVTYGQSSSDLGENRAVMMTSNGTLVPSFPDLGDGAVIKAVHEYVNGDTVVFVESTGFSGYSVMIRADGTYDQSWAGPQVVIESVFDLGNGDLLLFPKVTAAYPTPLVLSSLGVISEYQGLIRFDQPPSKVVRQVETGHLVAAGFFSAVYTKAYPWTGETARGNLARWHEGIPGASSFNPNAYLVRHNVNVAYPFLVGEGGLPWDHHDPRYFSSTLSGSVGAILRVVPADIDGTIAQSTDGTYTFDGEWALQFAIAVRVGHIAPGRAVRLRLFDSEGGEHRFDLNYDETENRYELVNVDATGMRLDATMDTERRVAAFELRPNVIAEAFPPGSFDVELEIDGQTALTVTYSGTSSPPDGVAANPGVTMKGENGTLYVGAPSRLPVMSDGVFAAESGNGQGYQFGDTLFTRVVDNQLRIDFNYSGSAGDYSGALTGVTYYGCDPVTGAVVETLTFDDITWVFGTYLYPIAASALDTALVWRGKLDYSLTNAVSGELSMGGTVDFPVMTAPTVELVSVDGTPVELVLDQCTSGAQYSSSGEYLTAVAFDDAGATGVDYGPHTAVVKVDGVDYNLDFEMIGW